MEVDIYLTSIARNREQKIERIPKRKKKTTMQKTPTLTVMLTYNDLTASNAYEIFDSCKDSPAEFWGFKEEPLPLPEMQELFDYMRQCGKKTVLEVVCYDEDESLAGAEMAVQCGCDYLMGTIFTDRILAFCQAHRLKYLPFVGRVTQRPSILEGEIDDMIAEAKEYLRKGVDGIDLLGYRYTGDASALIRRFVDEVPAPVCVAGSVNSLRRLDEIKAIQPWSFTIGSAFFDHCFGDSFADQIATVCRYMQGDPA